MILNKLTTDFSSESTEAKMLRNDMFQLVGGKKNVNQEFYTQQNNPSKWRRNETFSNKQKLGEFVTSRTALQNTKAIL